MVESFLEAFLAAPDGDELRTSWWHYREPGTYPKPVGVGDADRAVASLQVPADAGVGDTIHVIAEVTDSGKPPLTRYARVIVTVGESAERGEDR